jgi:RHS repeat-associated protein
MLVPNRTGSSTAYRYGFQGQEKDDELKGEGNSLNYTFRMHDPRVGRFFAVDPLFKTYPHNSTYAFSENRVIDSGELEGLERYYSADGKLLGKYGTSKEMRIVKQIFLDALNNKKIKIESILKSPPNNNTISIFNEYSIPAFVNSEKNRNNQLSKWAKTNRNTKNEKAMSLFTNKIENPEGAGFVEVFTLGSTTIGPEYKLGHNATVDPEGSIGISGWKRSTTVHTHPWGGALNFSNELSGFASGGDLQWSLSNGIDLYLVPPSGDEMGKFSVEKYRKILRSSLESQYSEYKAYSDSDIFNDNTLSDPYFNKSEAKSAMEKIKIE